MPASNGIATARWDAGFYAAPIGARILSRRMLAEARTEQAAGIDQVLLARTRFWLGFMLHGPASPMSSPAAFGHPGRGGSLAFADPELDVTFAYVTNGMQPTVTSDPRPQALVRAVRESVLRRRQAAAYRSRFCIEPLVGLCAKSDSRKVRMWRVPRDRIG